MWLSPTWRPVNRKKAIYGHGNEARVGLINRLGEEKALSIKTFDDHRELIRRKDELGIEAVVIAVPLSQHAPLVMEALDAGLHVLTEKLMAHKYYRVQGDDP